MVDLSAYKIRAVDSEYSDSRPASEIFYERMTSFGLKPLPQIVHGQLIRVPDQQDKGASKTGWYVYREFQDDVRSVNIGYGTFGTWHETFPVQHFCSKNETMLSAAERERFEKARIAAQEAVETEKRIRQDEAKQLAQKMWDSAESIVSHQYLENKKVGAYGIRQKDGELLVPIYDAGEIVSLQRIFPDGKKRFLSGGKIKGCHGIINGSKDKFYLCEGYSTAGSIHEATGATVYYAFNAGNLYEAAGNIKDRPLTICADNDINAPTNVGVNKAQQAGQAFGLDVIIPLHENDFNDMHVLHGIDAVKNQLMPAIPAVKKKEIPKQETPVPPGILADMAAYYNATSGNDQPIFAVQTALAIASVVCGRAFCSNYQNYSSLFFLNIGKSSTGKEHIKATIKNILDAAGCLDLMAGEGYTSKGAVFSALIAKPRHITIVDEFGRYMEASRKSGNSMQMEVNTQLMQSISSADGLMYSQVYSSMTGGKDKASKSEVVHNPAITLVGITTPSTFWDNMDIAAIKDGFLNRFVIGISDTPRTIRQHKEHVDVPEKISNWVQAIKDRRSDLDVSSQEPQKVVLNITSAADDVQREFQKYCIGIADTYEARGMAEISGRTNEMAMRIALICALARDPHAEFIDDVDMSWGVDYMRARLERVLADIKMKVSGSDYEKEKKEILEALRETGQMKLKDMYKTPPYSKFKNKDLKDMLDALVAAECAEVVDAPPEGRGRPTKIYMAI